MSYSIEILKNEDFKRSNWSGGITKELYIFPRDALYKELNFSFRISSATIDSDYSKFTNLHNIWRYITPLSNELKLKHKNSNEFLLNPFEIYKFDGGLETESFNSVTDFNVMIGKNCDGLLSHINLSSDSPILKLKTKLVDDPYTLLTEAFYCPYEDFYIKINDGIDILINAGELIILNIPKYKCPLKISIKLKNLKANVLRATLKTF